MEIASWLLIVAEIRENSGFRIESIRPVWIVHACCQNKQFQLALNLASIAESTLAVDTHQFWQRIVSSIAFAPTLINRINYQISSAERF